MTITIGRQVGALASTLAITALGLTLAAPATAADAASSRIGGTDRYETSALISKATFEPGVDVAYIASGVDYPDALAGGAVAGLKGAPVLLTKANSIPDVITTELDRLNPKSIVILGGESAVSAAVKTAADIYTEGPVTRIAGENRYATAGLLAETSFPTGANAVFVASGENFPDALGGAAAAAELGGPVLLTKASDLPVETELTLAKLTKLKAAHIVVLGGETAVSKAVFDKLATYDKGIERLAGLDRFTTSAAISADTFTSATTVYLANGLTFPDALSGAPAAGVANAPILLVTSNAVSQAVCDEVNRLQPTKVVALGGTTAVSAAVVTMVSTTCLAAPSIAAAATHTVTDNNGDKTDFTAGDVVTYSVTVTNKSAVTLHDVAVTGTVFAPFTLPAGTKPVVSPGASLTFTAKHTITAEDMSKVIVTNTITAVGVAPNGAVATSVTTDSWTPGKAPAAS